MLPLFRSDLRKPLSIPTNPTMKVQHTPLLCLILTTALVSSVPVHHLLDSLQDLKHDILHLLKPPPQVAQPSTSRPFRRPTHRPQNLPFSLQSFPFQLTEETTLEAGGPPQLPSFHDDAWKPVSNTLVDGGAEDKELPGFHDDAWMAVSNTVEAGGAEEDDEDILRGQDGLFREDVLRKPLHDKKVRV